MSSVMCNFHMDDLQGYHRYDMILGRYILYVLNIDLGLSGNTIRGDGGMNKVCTAPTKDISKLNFTS